MNFLHLVSFIIGICGIIGAFNDNTKILIIGTIISSLFCLKDTAFAMTVVQRIGIKSWVIIFSIICSLINKFIIHLSIPYLGWIIADSLFTLLSFLTLLNIVLTKNSDHYHI